MNEDLLYTNKFIPADTSVNQSGNDQISTIDRKSREDFRKSYELRYGNPAFRKESVREAGTDQIPGSLSVVKQRFDSSPNFSVEAEFPHTQTDGDNRNSDVNKGKRTRKYGKSQSSIVNTRSKIICIDSRDRDTTLYPFPSNFRIYLGEKFSSVRKIRLISTELPNTEQLIKSQPASKKNNKLYWQNGPNEEDSGQVYSITVTDGNYTAGTFAAEIKNKTASVERKVTTISGEDRVFSNFDIDVDAITTRFTMRQNKAFNLDNPISTTAGSSSISVNQDQHDLLPGQIINISGSVKVGGVPSSAINASQVIDVYIQRIDNLYRQETSSQKATYIIFGTTKNLLTGRVLASRGSLFVRGLGTQFLAECARGNVVHIGYQDYVIQNVIDDQTLTIETPFLESFDEFSLVYNLTTGESIGFESVKNDASVTKVNVINHRLRNIYATGAEIVQDKSYENDSGDLSLANYKQMQNVLTFSDLNNSFNLQANFDRRDPTYNNFSSFTISAAIQNFNLVEIITGQNKFGIIDQNNTLFDTKSLPIGKFSTIQMRGLLNSMLTGWNVSFDLNSLLFYIQPPISVNSVSIRLLGITDTYYLSSKFGLDFSLANSVASSLGFSSTQVFGNICISTSIIDPTVVIDFDSSLNSIFILSLSNTILYSITLNRSEFSTINDLINLIRSTFLSKGIPIDVTFNSSLNRVVFRPILTSFKFGVVFQQPSTPLPGLSDALGFESNFIHSNSTITSLIPISNYIQTGLYTFPLAEYINATIMSSSKQIRGTCMITNTSNIITGHSDLFNFADTAYCNIQTASAVDVSGSISNKKLTVVPSPDTMYNFTSDTRHIYFNPHASSLSVYQQTDFQLSYQLVTIYVVSMTSDGHFSFRLSSQTTIKSAPIIVEAGRTTVLDLRSIPSTANLHALKLSTVQNGIWNNGIEAFANRRYVFGGQFIQITPPLTAANSLLFVYDEFSEATCALPASSIFKFFVDLPADYILFGSAPTTASGAINYIQSPILNLEIGNVYMLDYSPMQSRGDILKLSTTLDGAHYFGSEFNANFISFNPGTTSNTIRIDLSFANFPFPSRLFYYAKDAKGAGGAGFLNIVFPSNSGAISIVNPSFNYYSPFLAGPIVSSISNDSRFVPNGFSLLYCPFNGLSSFSAGAAINLIDKSASVGASANATVSANTFSDGFNVNMDNNRFVLHDITNQSFYTIAISTGFRSPSDIAAELQATINSTLNLSSSLWNVVFDSSTQTYTFIISNGNIYEFLFPDIDTHSIPIFNSAAEILGFAQSDTDGFRPTNLITGNTIVSRYPVDLSKNHFHLIQVSTSQVNNLLASSSLAWSELIVQDNDPTYTALLPTPATCITGTRFTADLSPDSKILVGEDHDSVYTVTSIINDFTLQLDSNVTFVSSTLADDGTVIAAPASVFYDKLYSLGAMPLSQFLSNEKIEFFRSSQAKSTYDYDGRLINSNFQVTRISPIKISIVETDTLLQKSLTDVNSIDFTNISNHNLLFIKNNSKYFFNTQYPATQTIVSRGGNPVNVGTGVKFRLLFSNGDTPGDILGFPNVGDVIKGNTDFKTVQSNTIISEPIFNVVRSEVGIDDFIGYVKVVTDTDHDFEYGDTVFIENHKNSSNDLAVNNDEGYTILLGSQRTLIELENGVEVTRGVFYIPLSLSYGGSGGSVYKKQLYKPFLLAGENYLYLTSPTLASLATTSDKVRNVFAKLLLDAPPGAILFNSFVTSDKVFDETPLASLEFLDLAVVDLRGNLFEFNNINWSASFEITFASQNPVDSGVSSRTMEHNDL